MESKSAAFRRFRSVPLPFGADNTTPIHKGLPLPVLSQSPDLEKHLFADELSPRAAPLTSRGLGSFSLEEDDQDSRDSALGLSPTLSQTDSPTSRSPGLHSLLSDSDSHDEGFLDHFTNKRPLVAVPTSFHGLLNNLILSKDSSPLTIPKSDQRAQRRKLKASRRSLFSVGEDQVESDSKRPASIRQKRSSLCQDIDGLSDTKRRRSSTEDERPSSGVTSPSNDRIKTALDSNDQEDLIGDFSKPYALPTIRGKHRDLKSISPQTVSQLLDNKFSSTVERFTIVDCRYPYEYQGGHIKGALNVWERDTASALFMNSNEYKQPSSDPSKRHIIIFHCEFSSERGPKMLRFLRQLDRDSNKDLYPALCYPELYVMDGGYKAFYQTQKNHCVPETYLPMDHKDHVSDLKHFRVKSKSWGGEKIGRNQLRRKTSRQKLDY